MPKLNGCCLVIAGLLILTGCNNDKPKTKNPDRNTMPSVLKITPKRGVVPDVVPKVSTVAIAATGAQNGYLNKGDVVSVTVTFNGTVTVTGIPTLTLQVGNNDRPADYASGTGSKALVFNYTIGAEDNDTDGISIQEGELALPENVTIKSASGVDAKLVYDAVAADDDYKVDTVAPIATFSPANGTTSVAVTENLVLTFSENVKKGIGKITLYKESDTTEVETFVVATSTRVRIASSGKGVTIDPAKNLGPKASYHVQIDSGAFTDTAGNAYAGISDNAIWNFTSANINAPTPTISVVAITSSTGNHLLKKGDVVSVTVTFNKPVRVTGTPTLTLKVGGKDRTATYAASASSDTALVFNYTIAEGDNAPDVISIEAGELALPDGATIKSATANDLDAKLEYSAVAANDDYRVDTEAPIVETFSPKNNAQGVAVNTELELTFSENVKKGPGKITLYNVSNNTEVEIPVADSRVSIDLSGKVVTIDPAENLGSEASYYVQIDSDAFTDTAGNPYAGISDDTAWSFASADINAPILTISTIDSVISSGGHSNKSTITFQFTFNKPVKDFDIDDLIPKDKFSALTPVNGSKKSYTATLTNTEEGEITIAVKEGGYTSMAGKTGASVTPFIYTYDSTAPTLEITSDNVASGSTTNKKDIELKFTSPEAITGFTGDDIAVTNGELKEDSFKGSGESYTATFTATVDGTVTIKVKANAFTDTAGNNNMASTFTWTYDKTAPKAPVVSSGTTPTNDQTPTWSWSGDGGNGTYRYKLDNDDFTSVATYTTFTPSVNLPEGAHTLYVQERDEAGNWSESGSHTIVIDITPPVFTSVTEKHIREGADIYKAKVTDTSTVTYSLKAVNDYTFFSINDNEVTLNNTDDESKKIYKFTVVATDAAGNTAEQQVTLTLYPQAEFKAIEAIEAVSGSDKTTDDSKIKIKTFGFTWNKFSDADSYQLSRNKEPKIGVPNSSKKEVASITSDSVAGTGSTALYSHEDTGVALFLGERDWTYLLECAGATSALCNDTGLEHTFNQDAINKRIGYFRAEDPREKDYFGYSVSLSADGQTMAVGIPGANGEEVGRVEIYIADNSAVSGWSLQQTILADKPEGKDQFGFSVSLSADGKTLAVGAVGENRQMKAVGEPMHRGATLEGSSTDSTDSNAEVLIVSKEDKLKDGDSNSNMGAAYLFARAFSGDVYMAISGVEDYQDAQGDFTKTVNIATLLEGSGEKLDGAVGGVIEATDNEKITISFDQSVRKADNKTLTPTNMAELITLKQGDSSGEEIAFTATISDDKKVITISALLQQQHYIKARFPATKTHKDPMRFGFAVSLSGDGKTLAVGALGDNQQSNGMLSGTQNIQSDREQMDKDAGAVYLFNQKDKDSEWSFNQKIKPIWTNKESYFGSSVSLSHDGKTLAVGAPNEDGPGDGTGKTEDGTGKTEDVTGEIKGGIFFRADQDQDNRQSSYRRGESGAAYLFTYSSTSTPNWTQQHYIKTPSPKANDYFASSVSLSGDGKTLAVGSGESWGYDAASSSSSKPVDLHFSLHNAKFVNIYRKGDDWSKLTTLESPATANNMFGLSVSLNHDGKTLAVGGKDKDKDSHSPGIFSAEHLNSDGPTETGTVYLYTDSTDSTDSTDKFKLMSYINEHGSIGFGFSISLAADTSALAVGAPHKNWGLKGIYSKGQDDDDAIDPGNSTNRTKRTNSGRVYLY